MDISNKGIDEKEESQNLCDTICRLVFEAKSHLRKHSVLFKQRLSWDLQNDLKINGPKSLILKTEVLWEQNINLLHL